MFWIIPITILYLPRFTIYKIPNFQTGNIQKYVQILFKWKWILINDGFAKQLCMLDFITWIIIVRHIKITDRKNPNCKGQDLKSTKCRKRYNGKTEEDSRLWAGRSYRQSWLRRNERNTQQITEKEITEAINKFKLGKASGNVEIMMKYRKI